MMNTNENRKDNTIAWATTIGTMGLLLIFLLACSLKSLIPPPPPKNMVYVDIATMGGGGGGGTPEVASNPKPASGQNYATQNAQDAPAVTHTNKTSTNNAPKTPAAPKPDQSSMYHGRGGTGSGGGQGSGIGSGTGSGLGPGEGAGSGGGIGYGTGHRGMINNIDATVNEEGQVCVEVHIAADGHIIDARVINNNKYKTTITNRNIQQQCVARAKQARYKPGKEELRIIVFS
jgi:outer membrane biosynthesis protein TonB